MLSRAASEDTPTRLPPRLTAGLARRPPASPVTKRDSDFEPGMVPDRRVWPSPKVPSLAGWSRTDQPASGAGQQPSSRMVRHEAARYE